MRRMVEAEILRKFVDDALASGYRLSVSLERGYDIDEMLLGSTDRERIIAAAQDGDDCHIFVHEGTCDVLVGGQIDSIGWVYLVFGNDGWDLVSDYTTNMEELLKGALAVSEKYAD